MTDFATALELDNTQQIARAALAYAQVFESAAAPLVAYLNRIFLYWEGTHYDFHAGTPARA